MPDALPDRLSATATQPASSSNMAAKIVNNFTLIEASKGFFPRLERQMLKTFYLF